jgi:hypothetical protein
MLDTAFLGGTRAGFKSLRPAGPPDGESNEGLPSAGKVLEVVGEAVISPQPGESALDHPATGSDDETVHVVDALTISMRSTGTSAAGCRALCRKFAIEPLH